MEAEGLRLREPSLIVIIDQSIIHELNVIWTELGSHF